jgi:hypothetical protein
MHPGTLRRRIVRARLCGVTVPGFARSVRSVSGVVGGRRRSVPSAGFRRFCLGVGALFAIRHEEPTSRYPSIRAAARRPAGAGGWRPRSL